MNQFHLTSKRLIKEHHLTASILGKVWITKTPGLPRGLLFILNGAVYLRREGEVTHKRLTDPRESQEIEGAVIEVEIMGVNRYIVRDCLSKGQGENTRNLPLEQRFVKLRKVVTWLTEERLPIEILETEHYTTTYARDYDHVKRALNLEGEEKIMLISKGKYHDSLVIQEESHDVAEVLKRKIKDLNLGNIRVVTNNPEISGSTITERAKETLYFLDRDGEGLDLPLLSGRSTLIFSDTEISDEIGLDRERKQTWSLHDILSQGVRVRSVVSCLDTEVITGEGKKILHSYLIVRVE